MIKTLLHQKIVSSLLLCIFFLQSNAQWQPTNGPYGGGGIICMASTDSVIYAGCSTGFYSTDSSAVLWTTLSDSLPGVAVISVAVNSNAIYVGTNGEGLFTSSDNGISWTQLSNGLADTVINAIVFDTNNAGYIYTGTPHGVYLSTDTGATFSAINNGMEDTIVTSIAILGNKIYAGTKYNGAFLSSDSGLTWTAIDSGLTNFRINAFSTLGNMLFAATEGGIFRMLNDSIVWTLALNNSYQRNLFVKDSIIYALSSAKFSIDSGATWANFTNVGTSSKTCMNSVGNNLFIGTYSGVYKSTNNATSWLEANNGIKGSISDLACIGSLIYAATNGNGVFRYNSGNNTWTAVNNGLTNKNVRVLKAHNNSLYAGTTNGLFKSDNFGVSWDTVSFFANYLINSMAISDTLIFVGAQGALGKYLYKSVNSGISWYGVGNFTQVITSVAVSGQNVYVGHTMTTYARYSPDIGSTWSSISPGLSATVNFMSTLNNYVFTITNLPYRSNNNGTTWTNITNNLPLTFWNASSLYAINNNILIGIANGVFLSYNYGTSWIDVSNGLKYQGNYRFIHNGADIFLGTANGVWRSPIASVITSSNSIELQNEAAMLYPNPFQNSATLNFKTATVIKDATLYVYCINGKKVKTIENISESTIMLERDDLLPGIYFYTLSCNSNTICSGKFVIQ